MNQTTAQTPRFFTALFILLLLGQTGPVHADSPITSTDFHRAYNDINIVHEASLEGTLTAEMASFLSSDENPIDHKAALINALSWEFKGKKNALYYRSYLAGKYEAKPDKLDYTKLTPDEIFSLGYLTAMDNYFEVERAIPLLEMAKKRNPQSYTVALIHAIVVAQESMHDGDWCKVWKYIEDLQGGKEHTYDLREAAVEIIIKYMILYRDEC